MNKSDSKVKEGFVALFEKQHLCDVTIQAQGKEIKCHKVILASQSEWFSEKLCEGGADSIQLDHKHKVVRCMVRFMYFGGLEADLTPEEALDLLMLAEELRIKSLDEEDVAPHLKEPCLTKQNSIAALKHDMLSKYPLVLEEVCQFVGRHLLDMMATMESQLLEIPRHLLASVLRTACHYVSTDVDTEKVVRFCLKHTQLDSVCDLLRETKHWQWGPSQEVTTTMREVEPREGATHVEVSHEWRVENVHSAVDSTPGRFVEGKFFDWCIRLDYGEEGRMRIVYESATPREDTPRGINRFPAAMFAWNVIYRGEEVFGEKPVFICFPENVSLHWSTTLPVSITELTDQDDLRIMVSMAENPMLSLILYYFSSNIGSVVQTEDILNRLPHMEYRCLSSYSLVKTHVQPQP